MAVAPILAGRRVKRNPNSDPGRKTVTCSGPGCENALEVERDALPQGWYTVDADQPNCPASFCDLPCLIAWAATQIVQPSTQPGNDDDEEG